jgi:dimethylamine/trimethylamine dehydrogenase
VQRRLLLAGVSILANHALTSVADGSVRVEHVFSQTDAELPADGVVLVTARLPHDALYLELLELLEHEATGELRSVKAIGDAWAPGTIAAAVWSGRRYAEEFDLDPRPNDRPAFRREVTEISRD